MQGERHSTQEVAYGHGVWQGYPRKPWWHSSQGCQTEAPWGQSPLHCWSHEGEDIRGKLQLTTG